MFGYSENFSWQAYTIMVTIILIICITARIIYLQFYYWREGTVHLTPVPIFGNNWRMYFRNISLPDYVKKLYDKKFDKQKIEVKYYGLIDFIVPMLVLKDPELVYDVCVVSFVDHFLNHENILTEQMDPIAARNLYYLRDSKWIAIRKLVNKNFTKNTMDVVSKFVDECSQDFVQHFLDNPELASCFEAKDAFSRYACDVAATSAFGVKFNSMSKSNNEFYLHSKAISSFTIFDFIKYKLMIWFPLFMRRLFGATILPRATDRYFKNMIRETVKQRKEEGPREDLVHFMMELIEKSEKSLEVEKLTPDDIVAQAFFMLMEGFEYTSNLMCFMAHELAANPDIQENLYQHIKKRVAAKAGIINYKRLLKMNYLDMVVSETLRKYPPAPFTNRLCIKSRLFRVKNGQMDWIKKGTVIMIPIFGFHRDPKYFPEPDKFNPERFNLERKPEIKDFPYMPFGLGPRKCVGSEFAIMQAKFVIVHLLRNFVIKLTKKTQNPIDFSLSDFNTTAKNGFWLQLERRKLK